MNTRMTWSGWRHWTFAYTSWNSRCDVYNRRDIIALACRRFCIPLASDSQNTSFTLRIRISPNRIIIQILQQHSPAAVSYSVNIWYSLPSKHSSLDWQAASSQSHHPSCFYLHAFARFYQLEKLAFYRMLSALHAHLSCTLLNSEDMCIIAKKKKSG